ncbi:MAG: class I SAM-dependent methyltransferase [Gammaproteobacteria bacterium]
MEPQINVSCTVPSIDWNTLGNEQILKLNTYDFMGYLGKKIINPGGLEGRDLIVNSLNFKPNSRILEIGSGNGEAACYIGQNYDCELISVDISDHLVNKANKLISHKGLEHRVKAQQGDIRTLDFADNSFDYVISQGIIMLVDQEKAFREIIRVLKPGGYCSGLEFCWRKPPPQSVETATYNICGCQSLKFHSRQGWHDSLTESGFEQINIFQRRFNLFSVLGFIRDEGIINSLRIAYKVISKRSVKIRMKHIWDHFSQNIDYIDYVVYSCRKPVI